MEKGGLNCWRGHDMTGFTHGPRASVMTKASANGLGFVYVSPLCHVFNIAWQAMIKTYIITSLLCFLHCFNRFIPGFDRFIPGFDRFIPASIPVTGTAPYNPNAHLSIKCVLFCIWNHNKYLWLKKYQFWEQILSWKNTVDINPRLPLSHFNATGCRLWSTGSDRSHSSAVNSMQEEPSEIAVVQISRTQYITECYHNMVDQIPQKRILRPWNQ